MSLILDALRRAEDARDRDLGRRISHGLPLKPRPRWPIWMVWGVLVLLIAAGSVWWFAMPRSTVAEPPAAPVARASVPERDPPRGSSLADIPLPAPTPEPVEIPRSHAPLLHELPEALRVTVPALTVNAHVWTEDPSRRFVLLDMQRYREGDRVRDGLQLVAILPEGVELDWRGTRFRLLSQ